MTCRPALLQPAAAFFVFVLAKRLPNNRRLATSVRSTSFSFRRNRAHSFIRFAHRRFLLARSRSAHHHHRHGITTTRPACLVCCVIAYYLANNQLLIA